MKCIICKKELQRFNYGTFNTYYCIPEDNSHSITLNRFFKQKPVKETYSILIDNQIRIGYHTKSIIDKTMIFDIWLMTGTSDQMIYQESKRVPYNKNLLPQYINKLKNMKSFL